MERYILERDIAQRMLSLARRWRQLADDALAELRVSNTTGWCLIYLHRLGPEVRQVDLAQEIGISQPSMVRALDQLEQKGLVERGQNPDDRRSNRLTLTEEGLEVVGRIEEKLHDVRRGLLRDVPDSDLATVLTLFDRIADRMAHGRG